MTRQEWLQWRKGGIGSSDAPVLHGYHEYATPRSLWLEKLPETPINDRPSNFVQEKGNRLEPIARARFSEAWSEKHFSDIVFTPKLISLDELSFLRASLDGFAIIDGKRIGIEIKYMGKERHESVDKFLAPITYHLGDDSNFGRVPNQYWVQCQHQYAVAGLDELYFVSILSENEPIAYCFVPRDDEFIKEHVKVCAGFWKQVLTRTEPAFVDADTVTLTKKGSTGLARRYAMLIDKQRQLEKQIEFTKEKLLALVDKPRMVCGPLTFLEVERAGNVDYKKVPELNGVDLEPYRKAPSKYVKISVTDLSESVNGEKT